jgi:hypothetical protein|tara:strand:- start:4808 stop:4954 length:147 start_codon:yes stop_codon:yes gene_type:complete
MNPSTRQDYLEQIMDLEGENAELIRKLERKQCMIEDITNLLVEEEDAD